MVIKGTEGTFRFNSLHEKKASCAVQGISGLQNIRAVVKNARGVFKNVIEQKCWWGKAHSRLITHASKKTAPPTVFIREKNGENN